MNFKDAKRTSFAVGDKVRILPSAVDDGVHERAINKIGRIKEDCYSYYLVFMDKRERNNCGKSWAVTKCNLISAIKVGQQLLLWDDIFEVKI